MKKSILVLISILILCLAFAACSSNDETETTSEAETEVTEEVISEETDSEAADTGMVGLANPMAEYQSLEEINEKVGVNLIQPGVMGVTDETFYVINDTLAQYKFSLNGYEYNFRASKELDHDISGVYIGEGLAFEGNTEEYATIVDDDTYKLARFFVNDTQYTLCVTDNGEMDAETFDSIATELKDTVAG